MIVAIPIAELRKMPTATKDRMLNRGRPQSPCPLVQPLPSFVPKPTKSPASAKPTYDVWLEIYYFGPNGVNLWNVPYPKISKNIPLATNIPPTIIILSAK